MADSLQIYKVRPGLSPPRTVEHLEEQMLAPITAAEAERDVRRILPDFQWPAGAREVVYEANGITIELRLQSHGLFTQYRGPHSLAMLKAIVSHAGWLIVDPASLEFVR